MAHMSEEHTMCCRAPKAVRISRVAHGGKFYITLVTSVITSRCSFLVHECPLNAVAYLFSMTNSLLFETLCFIEIIALTSM